jgi:hypothetical protein
MSMKRAWIIAEAIIVAAIIIVIGLHKSAPDLLKSKSAREDAGGTWFGPGACSGIPSSGP